MPIRQVLLARIRPHAGRLPHNSLAVYATLDYLFEGWKFAFKFGVESFWFKDQVLGVSYNYDYTEKRYFTGILGIPFIEFLGSF